MQQPIASCPRCGTVLQPLATLADDTTTAPELRAAFALPPGVALRGQLGCLPFFIASSVSIIAAVITSGVAELRTRAISGPIVGVLIREDSAFAGIIVFMAVFTVIFAWFTYRHIQGAIKYALAKERRKQARARRDTMQYCAACATAFAPDATAIAPAGVAKYLAAPPTSV